MRPILAAALAASLLAPVSGEAGDDRSIRFEGKNVDGPTFQHGLQEIEGTAIRAPRSDRLRRAQFSPLSSGSRGPCRTGLL